MCWAKAGDSLSFMAKRKGYQLSLPVLSFKRYHSIGIVDHNYNKCKAVETVLSKLICQSVDFSPEREQPRYDHEQTFCLDYLLKIISVPETFIFLPPENSPE